MKIFGQKTPEEEKSFYRQVGINMHILCNKRGMQKRDFEKAIGTYPGKISAMIRTGRPIESSIMKAAANLLSVPVEVLSMPDIPQIYMYQLPKTETRGRKAGSDKAYGVKKSICRTCKYRASESAEWTCEYISITGHMRKVDSYTHCPSYERGKALWPAISRERATKHY